MTVTQPKVEFLVESLVEQINEIWWADMIDSGHPYAYKSFIKSGRKYIKLMTCDVTSKHDEYDSRAGGRVYMFIDKESGACYKPASLNAPAKGIRFYIEQLVETPEMCDPYGSFLYKR